MTVPRYYLTDKIYVESHPDRYVVSWPGGHRGNCADVAEMLGAVSTAITDTYAPRQPMRYSKHLIPPRPPECLPESA